MSENGAEAVEEAEAPEQTFDEKVDELLSWVGDVVKALYKSAPDHAAVYVERIRQEASEAETKILPSLSKSEEPLPDVIATPVEASEEESADDTSGEGEASQA